MTAIGGSVPGALALCAALSFPMYAVAQDDTPDRFAIDTDRIVECLATDGQAQARCIGQEAQACIAGNGDGPNMVLSACMGAEAAFWDDELNRVYARVRAAARDREAQDIGYRPGQLTDTLRAMQLSWIAYRDATCAHELARAAPFNSAMGPAGAGCAMRETARQVLELMALERSYGSDEVSR